jgi:hypothetical protein
VGESSLLVGCAVKQGAPVDPLFADGGRARHLRKEMHTTPRGLQACEAAAWRIDEGVAHYHHALTDIVEKASRKAVEYARQFDASTHKQFRGLVIKRVDHNVKQLTPRHQRRVIGRDSVRMCR